MRWQVVCFLALVAVFVEQCHSAEPGSETEGWDFKENYKVKDEESDVLVPKYKDDKYGSDEKDKKPYRKDDKYGSDEKKRPYRKDDKYESDEKKKPYRKDDKYGSDEKKKPYRKEDNDHSSSSASEESYRPKSRTRKSPDELAHMNIYVREPSKDGRRKKPRRYRFPVARYERKRFPQFGPLISFLPWVPIFVDRLTKQTIIYSPTGGVYIIPPLINFYGKLIPVGQLIASGYASLVSSGIPPPPAVDIAPLVQPGPIVGPGIPVVNSATGGFNGGIQTNYGAGSPSRPSYPREFEEDDYAPRKQGPSYSAKGYSRSQSRPTYDNTIVESGY